jgi:hypothetical protein
LVFLGDLGGFARDSGFLRMCQKQLTLTGVTHKKLENPFPGGLTIFKPSVLLG